MELAEGRAKGSVGSSRIRGTWIANNWPGAEIMKIGKKYDAIIFQKVYPLDYLKVFEGVKIIDICDPDWLEGKPVKESIELADAVTCSTQSIVDFVKQITDKPVHLVADRMDIALHPEKKDHKGKAESAVWFGYNSNTKVLDQCLLALKRLNLKLTVISDAPYYPSGNAEGIDSEWIKRNLTNIKHDNGTLNREIIDGGDILLNPRIETGRFRFKSNNKTLTGWALGMPVAETSDQLDTFMDPEARRSEAEKRYKEVVADWSIEKSVAEYRDIIMSIAAQKQ